MLASISTSVVATASCSNSDDDDTNEAVASGDDASGDSEVSSEVDAGAHGDGAPARNPRADAATSDAAPEAIVCASSSCATALATTIGVDDGFCVLLQDGTVACWGQNTQAQLGRGPSASLVQGSALPARVTGLIDIQYLDRGCAIDGAGSTWCWGTGPFLRSTTSVSTTESLPVVLPIPPARKVSIGHYFGSNDLPEAQYSVGCALVDSGVICWGTNVLGQVTSPELGVSPLAPYEPRQVSMPAGASIVDLVVGQAAFVRRSDGTVLSWGANPSLGRVSSLVGDPYPRPIPFSGISRLDAVNESACSVVQGIGYCWAGNPYGGQVSGVLTDTSQAFKYSTPYPVVTPEPIVDIATQSILGGDHLLPPAQRACAVGVSGDVYCWGSNEIGQAGDGSRDFAALPVKVVGLPARASVVKITSRSTCALLVTGEVYCWGDNAHGQLGNDDIKIPSSVPQKVLLP